MRSYEHPHKPLDYYHWAVYKLKRSGVDVEVVDAPKIQFSNGDWSMGEFIGGEKPVLRIATGHDQWFKIFVHEFQHYNQWMEGYKNFVSPEEESLIFDKWLLGEEVEDIENLLLKYKNMEGDCEVRTLKVLNSLDWGCDFFRPGEYAQMANAYIHLYDVLWTTRRWPDVHPSLVPKVFQSFEKKIRWAKDKLETNPSFLSLYIDNCYKEPCWSVA